MNRCFGLLIIIMVFAVTVSMSGLAESADNPVFRKLLSQKIKNTLSERNSEEKAWYSERSEPIKIKIPGGIEKTLGHKKTKTWVWLDNPNEQLSVEITRLEVKDGVVQFGIAAKGKVNFKAWGSVPNVVKADVKGSARTDMTIEGSAEVQTNRLSGAKVNRLVGKTTDVRFNNDALKMIQGLVQDALNWYIRHDEGRLKKELEKAINGVKF